jgi:hypothetical protein
MSIRKPAPPHQAMPERLSHPTPATYRTAALVQREVRKADATPAEKASKPSAARTLYPHLNEE